jgi:hypothetical protein
MKKTKAIIGVVVIFGMGVVCGALGDQISHKMMLRKYESGERNYYQDIVMKDLTKKLNLDTVQREKVDKIVKEMLLGMLVVRRQYQPQYQQLIEKQRSDIRPLLRPDQLEVYEKVIAHEQEKAQKRDRREERLVKSRQRPF